MLVTIWACKQSSQQATKGEDGGDECKLVHRHGYALRKGRAEGGALDALLLASDDCLGCIKLSLGESISRLSLDKAERSTR